MIFLPSRTADWLIIVSSQPTARCQLASWPSVRLVFGSGNHCWRGWLGSETRLGFSRYVCKFRSNDERTPGRGTHAASLVAGRGIERENDVVVRKAKQKQGHHRDSGRRWMDEKGANPRATPASAQRAAPDICWEVVAPYLAELLSSTTCAGVAGGSQEDHHKRPTSSRRSRKVLFCGLRRGQ